MNCLAIYIITSGYAKAILREIKVFMDYHLSSPEYLSHVRQLLPTCSFTHGSCLIGV